MKEKNGMLQNRKTIQWGDPGTTKHLKKEHGNILLCYIN